MKPLRLIVPAALAIAVVALVIAPIARPQGSLTPPPGPVSPNMKSLDQIASTGIPVNAATAPGDATALFVISTPGSYFLTGNLTGVAGKDGIRITSANVTLDLNGFSLLGAGAGLNGITDGQTHLAGGVHIHHGSISGWTKTGAELSTSTGIHLFGLSLSGNGMSGAALGDEGCAEDLQATFNNSANITAQSRASLVRCNAYRSITGHGIAVLFESRVSGCIASGNKLAGIFINQGSIVSDSGAQGNGSVGIEAVSRCVLENCSAKGNVAGGFYCGEGCSLTGCNASSNGAGSNGAGNSGAFLANAGCSLVNCNAYDNLLDFGFDATGECTFIHCLALRNSSGASYSGGFHAGSSVVKDCTAYDNHTSSTHTATTGMGFYCTGDSSLLENCMASANHGDGMFITDNSTVRGNHASKNGFAGIHVTGVSNRIEGNNLSTNGNLGLVVDAGVNVITNNTARNNTGGNYSIVAGNRAATVVVPAVSSVTGNVGGSAFSTDGFANIGY